MYEEKDIQRVIQARLGRIARLTEGLPEEWQGKRTTIVGDDLFALRGFGGRCEAIDASTGVVFGIVGDASDFGTLLRAIDQYRRQRDAKQSLVTNGRAR